MTLYLISLCLRAHQQLEVKYAVSALQLHCGRAECVSRPGGTANSTSLLWVCTRISSQLDTRTWTGQVLTIWPENGPLTTGCFNLIKFSRVHGGPDCSHHGLMVANVLQFPFSFLGFPLSSTGNHQRKGGFGQNKACTPSPCGCSQGQFQARWKRSPSKPDWDSPLSQPQIAAPSAVPGMQMKPEKTLPSFQNQTFCWK